MGPELGRTFVAIGIAGFVVFALIAAGCLSDARRRQDESRFAGKTSQAAAGCLGFIGIVFVLLALACGGCAVAYLTRQVK